MATGRGGGSWGQVSTGAREPRSDRDQVARSDHPTSTPQPPTSSSTTCFTAPTSRHHLPLPPPPPLAHPTAYALHCTRLTSSVTFAALYLLQRLKIRFIAARSSSGHRLFISAFMIASKVICDDTYSNKSWCIVGQGMFAPREINQMEWEMCSYSGRHPFVRSRSPSIPTNNRLFNAISEVLATVLGRVLPHPNRCPAATLSPLVALERSLPCQLDVPRDSPKLRGRQREDSFFRHLQHDANPGRQRLSTIPPRSLAKVFVTNTGAPEDTNLNRHKASITEENVEWSSALGSREVECHLRVCSVMHLVNQILVPFTVHPHSTPS